MAALHIFLAFLLNSILQIFFVAAIAWGCSLVARRARAGIRHAIWVLALLASTLLPVLSLTVAHGRGLAVQSARWNQIDQFRQKIDNSFWIDGDRMPGANVAPKGSRLRLLF